MTLRNKTIIIITGTFIVLIAVLHMISQKILLDNFKEMEEGDTLHAVERVMKVLSYEISTLNAIVGDWAGWDDTYNYILDGNETYVNSNLVDETYAVNRLNIIVIIDSSGRIVYGRGFDLHGFKEMPLSASLIKSHLQPGSPLLQHNSTESSRAGVVFLPEGPLLIASRPIITSKLQGPIRGTIIMGRYLDEELINKISDISQTSLTLREYNDPGGLADFRVAKSSLTDKSPVFVRPLNNDDIAGYALVKDVYGKPGLILRTNAPRDLFKQGRATIVYIVVAVTAVALIMGFVVLFLLEKAVLSRLTRLSNSVNKIGSGNNLSERVDITGNDELSGLADNINGMLGALSAARAKYKELFDFLPITVFEIDESRYITLINQNAYKMFGYTDDTIIDGFNVLQVIAPEDCSIARENIQRVLDGEILSGREYKAQREDGKRITIFVNSSPIVRDGKIVGVRGSIVDVSERKEIEERLRESEEKFRLLFENSPLGIMHFDNQGVITDCNEKFATIIGSSKDILVGLNLLSLPNKKVVGCVKEALAGGQAHFEGEYYAVTSGKTSLVKADYAPITINSGSIIGGVGIVEDIRERKEAEEQLIYLSYHDSLTGLYNRVYFEQELRRIEKGRLAAAGIIVCDVDGLKLVNDTLGHDVGDTLLAVAAGVIRDSFRKEDVVARIGGDEFAVLLPDSSRDVVEIAHRRLKENIEKYNTTNPDIPLSISAGYAFCGQEFSGVNELFKAADNSMYREKLHSCNSARSAIVQTLMKALEARDFITEGHADRLQDIVARMAQATGLNGHKAADLRLFAQFHDIGKVGIPDRILFKPGPLTPEEYSEMQKHCEIGHRIALSSPDLATIADWILKHHEWWNGGGYPLGLEGREIPLECRILGIADAYDAMVSDRPYRRAMPQEEAVKELKRCAGTQFDPELVDRFVAVFGATAVTEPADCKT